MIERYTAPEMAEVWTEERKYAYWARVELAVADASEELGILPPGSYAEIAALSPPSPRYVAAYEARTRHDVVAFLQAWTDDQSASWLHYGMTSSDLVDTALSLAVRDASRLIEEELRRLFENLRSTALEHESTWRLGRTHGRPAEISSWGYRMADFAFAAHRALHRHRRAVESASIAMISGTVGTYAHLPPSVEQRVAAQLGLHPAGISTQVIMRDRLVDWAWSLVQVANLCESIAMEVRLSSHLDEVSEGRVGGQVGSSAMPHKINPITSEKICGLARLARGYMHPLTESIALWHDRDISHSSVERVALVDLSISVHHVLQQTSTRLVRDLQVDSKAMFDAIVEAEPTIHTAAELNRRVVEGQDRWQAHAEIAAGDVPVAAMYPPEWYARHLGPVFSRLASMEWSVPWGTTPD